MNSTIRVSSLLIWSGWLLGSVASILGAIRDFDAGVTGLLIVLMTTIAWIHMRLSELSDREQRAFDLGREVGHTLALAPEQRPS